MNLVSLALYFCALNHLDTRNIFGNFSVLMMHEQIDQNMQSDFNHSIQLHSWHAQVLYMLHIIYNIFVSFKHSRARASPTTIFLKAVQNSSIIQSYARHELVLCLVP